MNTSILQQELEPLKAQIEQAEQTLARLENDLRHAGAELETRSADRQRFDALQAVCAALDRLDELEAVDLFWEGLPPSADPSAHRQRIQARIDAFEGEIRQGVESQQGLEVQIEQVMVELDDLHEEVRQAYAREERRLQEFAVDREPTLLPVSAGTMPWSGDVDSEGLFRRTMATAMALCLLFGVAIPLVNLPMIDRKDVVVDIPERLAMLVKKEPPRPEPVAEAKPEKKPEKPLDETKPKPEKQPEKVAEKPQPEQKLADAPDRTKTARKKAESTGVLAFKNSFADLMDEAPTTRLGTEARLVKEDKRTAGQARPTRSLVAMQAKGGSSGGIANAGVSRNLGGGGGSGDRIGGVGVSKVESSLAGIAEKGRPLSDGTGASLGRTDEEIQIVFDRYKAALYRIYNKELRRDPTLRGKLLLKLTIEPNGEVSLCKVESTDLGSEPLVASIVARVERFNFGPKEGVPPMTILYPIDFLPAG